MNTTANIEKKSIKNPLLLDKLAVLGTTSPTPLNINGIQKLKKRAKAKYITIGMLNKLLLLDSPLKKSYTNTFFCCHEIIQQGEKLTSKYCNNRWCIQCNRIRTAKLINAYTSVFTTLSEPFFVTLTIPNCNGEVLRSTIEKMTKSFSEIAAEINKKFHRGKGKKFLCIRKTEVTINNIKGDYHPHLHCIIDGLDNSEYVVSKWLQKYTDAEKWCQRIQPANKNSMIELFKYTTKIVTTDKKRDAKIYTSKLDVIFQALRKKNTFETYGIQKVSEDIEELQTDVYTDIPLQEYVVWEYIEHDWYNKNTGEELTGYVPGEFESNLMKNIY